MLHRYWFITEPANKFGAKNIGVTAHSIQEAKSLIKELIKNISWTNISDELIDEAEIIENIDITLLDQNHIIPNMGVVTFIGVWYPNLNLTMQ